MPKHSRNSLLVREVHVMKFLHLFIFQQNFKLYGVMIQATGHLDATNYDGYSNDLRIISI